MTTKTKASPKKKAQPLPSQQRDGIVSAGTPGYKFVWLLRQMMAERDCSIIDLSESSGVSRSTISHLQTGRRTADRLDKETIVSLAKWVGIPTLSAMLLSEQLTPSDFYTDASLLDANIERAVRFILRDGDWGAYAPKSILEADRDMKLYIIWCYEQATKTKLLSGSVDFIGLTKSLEEFREEHPISAVE